MSVEPLSDAGGVRPVTARWVVTGDLVLDSAAHVGSGRGTGDGPDMVLLRDAREGRPLLPGTSLAGALRCHLADVLGGYRSDEAPAVARLFGAARAPRRRHGRQRGGAPAVARLFGAARSEDAGTQSPLIVFDSLGILPDGQAAEIRDGVQIDVARGTAAEHKKFDLEVAPAGTRFPLRFDLIVPDAGVEAELVSLLVASLNGLMAGDLSLGARRSRGLGAVHATDWRAIRHELTSREGWIGWVTSDPEAPIAGGLPGAASPAAACRRAFPGLDLRDQEDRRRRLVVVADLSVRGGLLVRSAPTSADAPDAVQLQSGGRSVLPGTSVAGALRSRALRIARIVRAAKGDAEWWVDRLFGPRTEGVSGRDAYEHRASHLRVSEGPLHNGTGLRIARVRIDRFAQGVVPGALFDEEPEYGSAIRITFELRDPQPGEPGLLYLVLKDLLAGDVIIGGTGSVGRGVLCGAADVRTETGERIRLDPQGDTGPANQIDHAIQEFWELDPLRGPHE